MTKGQTEFLVAISAIAFTLGAAILVVYESHKAIAKPQHLIVEVVPTLIPTPTPTINGVPVPVKTPPMIISVPVENCDVVKSIHVTMTKSQVIDICGNPERIDDSSAAVKLVERVFKHDEIWYYDKQSETVELTNDIVTSVHSTVPSALPEIH